MMLDRLCVAASFAIMLVSQTAHASPELARAKNCVACHHVEQKRNGPSYKEVAERYANNGDALKILIEKVRAGGAGTWGASPMPPQPGVSPEEAETLVKWIMTIK